jgi:glyoxylase-like metal-dependent hydrolase (beta-lactamase superfamily II)
MTNAGRRFGQYDVIQLFDGVFQAPTEVLIHGNGDAARRSLLESWGDKGISIDVNCLALRGPDGITLIDAGTGDAWGPAYGKARRAMEEEGITPEQVDRVLLTHIHGDHALGLLDGSAPWFPRAEVWVPEADLAFFIDAAARAAQPENRRGGFDIAANLVSAYAERLRPIPTGPVSAMPGIEAIPLPGHTPGHTGYLLSGAEESLLIWADALHLQDAQTADPEIGLIYDVDPAEAVRSRRRVLEQAAESGWMAAGSHVTGFGHVQRAGDAFRFVLG